MLVSIGRSLIASAIVSYLASIYLFKRLREKELSDKWGLETICELRSSMNDRVFECLRSGARELDIVSYGLKSFRETRG